MRERRQKEGRGGRRKGEAPKNSNQTNPKYLSPYPSKIFPKRSSGIWNPGDFENSAGQAVLTERLAVF